jgi:hypothetical protein
MKQKMSNFVSDGKAPPRFGMQRIHTNDRNSSRGVSQKIASELIIGYILVHSSVLKRGDPPDIYWGMKDASLVKLLPGQVSNVLSTDVHV